MLILLQKLVSTCGPFLPASYG